RAQRGRGWGGGGGRRSELSRPGAPRPRRPGFFARLRPSPPRSLPPAAPGSWHASGMASQAASGGTPTSSPAVAVVVGEEELLVERAGAPRGAAGRGAHAAGGARGGPVPPRRGG